MAGKVDLSQYTIRLADPTQTEELWRAAFVPWGRGKTWETFLEERREVRTSGAWAEDGGFKSWVLVKRDDFEGSIYAGCETFRRKSLVRRAGTDEVEEAYSYGIASVVTPVQHLRKGYATHHLRLLHYILGDPSILPPFPSTWGTSPPKLSIEDRKQVPIGIGSILWSDVGSTFYERVTIGTDWPGWITRDDECQQITWKLRPSGSSAPDVPKQWKWIYSGEYDEISQKLSTARREEMKRSSAQSTIWSVDPATPGTLGYVPSRAMFARPSDWTYPAEKEPCGIRIPSTQAGGEDAIVIFTLSTGKIARAVLITLVHALEPEQVPVLLEALDEIGGKMGLEDGLVWGVQGHEPIGKAFLEQKDRQPESRRRDEIMGHLLGVAWYGRPEERGKFAESQMWSWC